MTLRVERPLSLSGDAASLPRDVSGNVAFLEDDNGLHAFEQMHDPTHVGVYDLDLRAIGLPAPAAGDIPGVAARTAEDPARSPPGPDRDSVHIVVNPSTPRYSLRMAGTFSGDAVRGVWVADTFMGGGGTFTLHRWIAPGASPH